MPPVSTAFYPNDVVFGQSQYFTYISTAPGATAYSINPSVPAALGNFNTTTGQFELLPVLVPSNNSITFTVSTTIPPTTYTNSMFVHFDASLTLLNTFYLAAGAASVNIEPVYNATSTDISYNYDLYPLDVTGGLYPQSFGAALPTGLTLNATTGAITGSLFTTSFPFTAFQIRVGNASVGYSYTVIYIAVDVVPIFYYPDSPYIYCVDASVNIVPVIASSAASVTYTIKTGTPGLPSGLSLNPNTGVISGVALASDISEQTYTIVAQTTSGSPLGYYETTIEILINDTPIFSYAGSPFVLTQLVPVRIAPVLPNPVSASNAAPFVLPDLSWNIIPATFPWGIRSMLQTTNPLDNSLLILTQAQAGQNLSELAQQYKTTNGVFLYNSDTQHVNNISNIVAYPNNIPGVLQYAGNFVYADSLNKILIFGSTSFDTLTKYNGLYSLNTSSYTVSEVIPYGLPANQAPEPRTGSGIIYDSVNDILLLFGGVITPFPAIRRNDLWMVDCAQPTLSWTLVIPNGDVNSPQFLRDNIFTPWVYWPTANGSIIFLWNFVLPQTWFLDHSVYPFVWTQLFPPTTLPAPTKALVYEAVTDNIVALVERTDITPFQPVPVSTYMYNGVNQTWVEWISENPLPDLIRGNYDGQIKYTYNIGENGVMAFYPIAFPADNVYLLTTTEKNSASAPNLQNGITYQIVSVGSTNWTLLGAASSTAGLIFTSNGTSITGSGVCVAKDWVNYPVTPTQATFLDTGLFAYDTSNNNLLLVDPSFTFVLDWNTQLWTNKAPAALPPVQFLGPITYTAANDTFYLLGGESVTPVQSVSNVLYEYTLTGNTWSAVTGIGALKPSARFRSSMISRTGTNELILFGGIDAATQAFLNDLWSYNIVDKLWTQVIPTGVAINGRAAANLAYNFDDDSLVVYGGVYATTDDPRFEQNDIKTNDVWEFSFTQNVWTKLIDATLSSSAPRAQVNQIAWNWDPSNNVYILAYSKTSFPIAIATWAFKKGTNGQLSQWKYVTGQSPYFDYPLFNATILNRTVIKLFASFYAPKYERILLATPGINFELDYPYVEPEDPNAINVTYSMVCPPRRINTIDVVPALPRGMVLDPATGVISGTPTVLQPPYKYTIRATNECGSYDYSIIISVVRPYTGGRAFGQCYDTIPNVAMRRKATVLQHRSNANSQSRQQIYANAVTGRGPYGNRVWATQGTTYTNPNITGRPVANNNILCPANPNVCSYNYYSDVPGPTMLLCENSALPPVRFIQMRNMGNSGGTKWPQQAWSPAKTNGFPIGKAGRQ